MTKAFTLKKNDDGIYRLVFDLPGEKVNKFSLPVLEELEAIIDELAKDKSAKALLITSGKEDIFIAGADLHGFAPAFKDPALLDKLLQTGHRVFNKLEALPFPSVALINGACLGGGMEFALACTYRIATDNPKTSLGLPETSLGIIPGWGGSQRAPRLVGLVEGVSMIAGARPVNGLKAYKIKLVDAYVSAPFAEGKALEFINDVLTEKGAKKVLTERQRGGLMTWVLEKNPIGRAFFFKKAKAEILKKTKGHYPAPLLACELIESSYGLPLKQGLQKEIETLKNVSKSGKEVKGSDIALNLINLFFTNEALKKDKGVKGDVPAKKISAGGVLGAGTMGSGIAWLFTNNFLPVRMKDINWEAVGKGYGTASAIYQKLVKDKKLRPSEADLKFDLLSGTIGYEGFKRSDLIVEAATENLELKHKILKELEQNVRDDAVIASNTSSLGISEMAASLKRPERFIGMHFFNPPNKMPLVEIIPGKQTSPETIATAVEISKKFGKTPIVVQDCAGFLVNRVFVPAANEVMWMLQERVDPARIEKQLLGFGMPMSPFVLADEVGNDVSYHVSNVLEKAYGERMRPPEFVKKLFESGLLGRKVGKGFYLYNGKDKKQNPEIDKILSTFPPKNPEIKDADIRDRFVLLMLNESARCLQEKVIENPAYLDMALIMGIGFPPFRGGLLRYADARGIDEVVQRLNEFQRLYGERFRPAELLLEMKKNKTRFYQD